mgnify:CR=1 FL=1
MFLIPTLYLLAIQLAVVNTCSKEKTTLYIVNDNSGLRNTELCLKLSLTNQGQQNYNLSLGLSTVASP